MNEKVKEIITDLLATGRTGCKNEDELIYLALVTLFCLYPPKEYKGPTIKFMVPTKDGSFFRGYPCIGMGVDDDKKLYERVIFPEFEE